MDRLLAQGALDVFYTPIQREEPPGRSSGVLPHRPA
jgi:hypothetical protein